MELTYSYKFLAQSSSVVPSSPWQSIQIFVEQETEVLKKVLQKGREYHIDIREVENGTFIERYELA